MSQVNFVEQFNLFMEYARENCMPGRESMLWMCLFYCANRAAVYHTDTKVYEWPDDFFSVSNAELNSFGQFDKRTIETLRNSLKQRGLIDFVKGDRKRRNPAYKMFYLARIGCRIVPNTPPNEAPNTPPNVPPNNVPNGTPNSAPSGAPNTGAIGDTIGRKNAPIYLNINNKPGINTGTRARATETGTRARPDGEEIGLVDFGTEPEAYEGLVPLPWD